uniref:Uncharacterized protein n=1 Tax=Anopheles melas TaxID=34690 RepID=A0A182TX22_9DIPT
MVRAVLFSRGVLCPISFPPGEYHPSQDPSVAVEMTCESFGKLMRQISYNRIQQVRANIPPAGQCGLAALVSGTALLSRSKLRRVRLEKFSSCPGPKGGRPERLQIHRRFQCEKSVPEPSERR